MITYQDLLSVGERDEAKMEFVRKLISVHKSSDEYKMALDGQAYFDKKNTTIMEYQKLLYTISGEVVPDNYSANYKIQSSFFNRFVIQQTQYLLGNGMILNDSAQKDKLGNDFDTRLQEAGLYALVDGVSFGFWNLDHMEVFRLTEFCPLYDEENGSLSAGVRFWQVDFSKPLRATLYELDGYTEYIWRDGDGEIYQPKRKYVVKTLTSAADGTRIYDGYNYPTFPIVPLWGNLSRQSELVGIRQGIDAYDLIKSGFANDLDDASQIYWTIQNAGGMDDIDLVKFIQHMKTVKAAAVDDEGARAESHTIHVPYEGREVILSRLRNDLYDDYMALDTKIIAGGATTATQIRAAYEPLNNKTDMFEYCVLDFLNGILSLAGVDGDPTFTRSIIVNTAEGIQSVLQAADFLSSDYITEKILALMGDADKAEDILKQKAEEEAERYQNLLMVNAVKAGAIPTDSTANEEEDEEAGADEA